MVGVEAMYSTATLSHDVLVVAPDGDRSGASNSLTLDAPIRVVQVDETTWKVFGTPTDCVHVAITGMFDRRLAATARRELIPA